MSKHGLAGLLGTGLCVICVPVLLAACSVGNDFGATLPVSNTYPSINSVPPRPQQPLSHAEKDEMLREMQDLQQNRPNSEAEAN